MAPTPLHPGFPGHTCRWPSLGALLQQGPLTAITSTINFSTLITTAWWHLTSTFCLPVTVLRALHMYPIWPSPQTCKTDPHILFILQVKALGKKKEFSCCHRAAKCYGGSIFEARPSDSPTPLLHCISHQSTFSILQKFPSLFYSP